MTKKIQDATDDELRLHTIARQVQDGLRELGINKVIERRDKEIEDEMAALEIGDVKKLIHLQAERKFLRQYYNDVGLLVVGSKLKEK